MNKSFILVGVLLSFLTACSLWGSINARKLLTQCKYQVTSLEVELAKFKSSFLMGKDQKEVKISDGLEVLQAHWSDIKKGRFEVDLRTLKLKTLVQITNPNSQEVIVDSLVLDAFMSDGEAFSRIGHYRSLEIPSGSQDTARFDITIPVDMNLKNLMNEEKIKFQGTVWSQIKLTEGFSGTIPLPVSFDYKIPREEIQKQMNQHKSQLIQEAEQKVQSTLGISNKKIKSLKSKAKKFFRGL